MVRAAGRDSQAEGAVFACADPLLASAPLPFHDVFFPHGFPVHVRSDDVAVIRAAEICWGAYRQRYREVPMELRFLVSQGSGKREPPIPVFRAQGNLLTIVADAQNFGCCDLTSGFGFAMVSRAALRHPDYLRFHFMDSMAYSLLDTRHLVALHAACVGRNGCGFLFAGQSGAGKSSLAYACTRRGWTFVSDDASCLVLRRRQGTAVGNPRAFHFKPAASTLFPELAGQLKARNGKPTLEVETAGLAHVKIAYEHAIGYVVFLNRQNSAEGRARLDPVSTTHCLKRLFQNPWPAELAIHQERMDAIERLMEVPAYELSYQDFGAAIDLLEELACSRPVTSGAQSSL